MKKFFFSYLALLLVTATLGAQNYVMKSMQMKAPVEVSSSLTWLHNYNADFEGTFGFGAGTDADFGGWVGYKTDKLAEFDGKTITAVKIYVNEDMDDATVWVRKGNETVDKAASVAEVKVNLKGSTWSYIKFEEPITIDASTKYYIGYQGHVTATSGYPVAGDRTSLTVNDKGMSGVYYDDGRGAQYIDFADNSNYREIGHLLVAALIDGNADECLPAINMQSVDFGEDLYLEIGTKITPVAKIDNAGYNGINSFEISYIHNGEEQTVTSEAVLDPFGTVFVDLPEISVSGNESVSVKLSKVNDTAVENAKVFSIIYKGYNSAGLVDRTALLLEKFTGQMCGYCPSGETYVNDAIKGYESRAARINHHYGFMEDIFTLEESAYTGYLLQVAGAPSLAVNRTCYPSMAEKMGTPGIIPFHPSLLSGTFIKNELDKKSLTSISASDSYDQETREYSVSIKGTGAIDMKGMFVTAILTQSGYAAYQYNGGANYIHDDFPILYLSEDYEGTEITTEGEEWSVTLTKKIPETIGQNVKVDLDKLKLVAFVNGPLIATVPEQMVLNALTQTAATVTTSIENTEMENVNVYPEEGRIVVEGEYDSYEVYNAEGVRLSNEGLNAGLYIVKVVANGKTHTVKVMVR